MLLPGKNTDVLLHCPPAYKTLTPQPAALNTDSKSSLQSMNANGCILAIFRHTSASAEHVGRWVKQLQLALMRLPWPEKLLTHAVSVGSEGQPSKRSTAPGVVFLSNGFQPCVHALTQALMHSVSAAWRAKANQMHTLLTAAEGGSAIHCFGREFWKWSHGSASLPHI